MHIITKIIFKVVENYSFLILYCGHSLFAFIYANFLVLIPIRNSFEQVVKFSSVSYFRGICLVNYTYQSNIREMAVVKTV